jgi:hypothetical protein
LASVKKQTKIGKRLAANAKRERERMEAQRVADYHARWPHLFPKLDIVQPSGGSETGARGDASH